MGSNIFLRCYWNYYLLATVIPVVGYWLCGDFCIDHPALNRFFNFHNTLSFILADFSIFHIAALHQNGSTDAIGVNTQTPTVPFSTSYGTKVNFVGHTLASTARFGCATCQQRLSWQSIVCDGTSQE